MQTGLLLAALLLAPIYTMAADAPIANSPTPNWYSIELVVFRYADPHAGSLETWPINPGTPDWDSAAPLSANGSRLPYMQLPSSSYRLDNEWLRFKRSSDYQPLLHVAWVQPAIDRASALFVRIGVPPAAANTATPAATANAATDTQVYGIAKLSTTGLYLHFDLDLMYCGPTATHRIAPISTTPAPTAEMAAAAAMTPSCQPYRLKQDRKIDAGKLNYFDNPLFGVLVLITPIKK